MPQRTFLSDAEILQGTSIPKKVSNLKCILRLNYRMYLDEDLSNKCHYRAKKSITRRFGNYYLDFGVST
jgi:hypothetical protein